MAMTLGLGTHTTGQQIFTSIYLIICYSEKNKTSEMLLLEKTNICVPSNRFNNDRRDYSSSHAYHRDRGDHSSSYHSHHDHHGNYRSDHRGDRRPDYGQYGHRDYGSSNRPDSSR